MNISADHQRIVENGARVVPTEMRPRYHTLVANSVSRAADELTNKAMQALVTRAIEECHHECRGCSNG